MGHTPFGHAGEFLLNQVYEGGFRHNEQSVRIVEKLEKDGLYVMGVGDFTGEVQKTTTIYVRRKKWGRYLKDYFKNPTIQEADALTNGADVEIVLGTEDALN